MARERIRQVDSTLRPWILAGVLLAVALGAGAYMFFREVRPEEKPSTAGTFGTMTGISGPRLTAMLYFPSAGAEYLVPEEREVAQADDMTVQVRTVVEELIRGPVGKLTPSFPPGTRVKDVFIDGSGTAYVDFSRELQTEYPGGAWTETLTIYSLADTLCGSFPDQVKAVQILIDGQEVPTLAGHIDTSRPFAPNVALIRE
jgi:hypothetical protein